MATINLHTKGKAPKELLAEEVQKLLTVTGSRVAGWRDHLLFSLAVGSGMREHELAALRWEQLVAKDGKGRSIREVIEIAVFKGSKRIGGVQEVRLPPDCRRKLYNYWHHVDCPTEGYVFTSRQSGDEPMALRTMRHRFTYWQKEAAFERRYTFHALRHTYCRRLLDLCGDLTIVRKAARHARIETTAIYTEPGDERLTAACRKLGA